MEFCIPYVRTARNAVPVK